MRNTPLIAAAILLATQALAALALLVPSAARAAERATEPPVHKTFASMTYPVPGNIHWDEGSVEMWVVSDFDTEKPQPGDQILLFDIKPLPNEPYHYCWLFVGGSLPMIGFTAPRQSYVWSGKLNWKPRELHYVVWTWSGRTRSVFIDGKAAQSPPLAEDPLQGPGRGSSAANVLVEGWVQGDQTEAKLFVGMTASVITVDEIRISSVARTAEEVARTFAEKKAPTADAFTLLLDHCDSGRAEKISGFNGETGAVLSGTYKVIDSTFGKALQLWVPTN